MLSKTIIPAVSIPKDPELWKFLRLLATLKVKAETMFGRWLCDVSDVLVVTLFFFSHFFGGVGRGWSVQQKKQGHYFFVGAGRLNLYDFVGWC